MSLDEIYVAIRSLWLVWLVILFVGIVGWVFWPSRKQKLEDHGSIPLRDHEEA
jgi:cytochrome c oxidase cbb3-type subunit 4